MNDIRYLLDENVAPLFRAALLKREPKLVVWKIGDPGAPPTGTPDPAILQWCEENSFILVTNNRKSMPQHFRDHLASFCLETSGPGSHARHPAAWEPPLLGFPDKN